MTTRSSRSNDQARQVLSDAVSSGAIRTEKNSVNAVVSNRLSSRKMEDEIQAEARPKSPPQFESRSRPGTVSGTSVTKAKDGNVGVEDQDLETADTLQYPAGPSSRVDSSERKENRLSSIVDRLKSNRAQSVGSSLRDDKTSSPAVSSRSRSNRAEMLADDSERLSSRSERKSLAAEEDRERAASDRRLSSRLSSRASSLRREAEEEVDDDAAARDERRSTVASRLASLSSSRAASLDKKAARESREAERLAEEAEEEAVLSRRLSSRLGSSRAREAADEAVADARRAERDASESRTRSTTGSDRRMSIEEKLAAMKERARSRLDSARDNLNSSMASTSRRSTSNLTVDNVVDLEEREEQANLEGRTFVDKWTDRTSSRRTSSRAGTAPLIDQRQEEEGRELKSGRINRPLPQSRTVSSRRRREYDEQVSELEKLNLVPTTTIVGDGARRVYLKVNAENGDIFYVEIDLSSTASITLDDSTRISVHEGDEDDVEFSVTPEQCASMPTCGVLAECDDKACVFKKERSSVSKKVFSIVSKTSDQNEKEIVPANSPIAYPLVKYEELLANVDKTMNEIHITTLRIRSLAFQNLDNVMGDIMIKYQNAAVKNSNVRTGLMYLKTALDNEYNLYFDVWQSWQVIPNRQKNPRYKMTIDKLFQINKDYAMILSEMEKYDAVASLIEKQQRHSQNFLDWMKRIATENPTILTPRSEKLSPNAINEKGIPVFSRERRYDEYLETVDDRDGKMPIDATDENGDPIFSAENMYAMYSNNFDANEQKLAMTRMLQDPEFWQNM